MSFSLIQTGAYSRDGKRWSGLRLVLDVEPVEFADGGGWGGAAGEVAGSLSVEVRKALGAS